MRFHTRDEQGRRALAWAGIGLALFLYGGFSWNEFFFSAAGVFRSPLVALRDGEDGPSGVYRFGASGFPDQTYHAANYWVDVVFSPTP